MNNSNRSAAKQEAARQLDGDPKVDHTLRSRRAGPRGWLLAVVVAVAGGMVGGYIAKQQQTEEEAISKIVIPQDPAKLDPQLGAYLLKFIQAAEADPAKPEVHAELGLVYEANEMWPEAQASLEIAAELEPTEPLVQHHIAVCVESLGKIDEVIELRRGIAERFPDLAYNHQTLGNLLLDQGRLDEAEAAYQETIRLAPDKPAGHVGAADVQLRRGLAAQAVETLEPIVQAHPTNKSAHQLLGLAYQRLGREAEAKRELALGQRAGKAYLFDPWTRRLPPHSKAVARQNRRATTFLSLRRPDAAAAVLREMLRWHPENVPGLNNLAIAYLRTNRLADAQTLLLRAAQIDEHYFQTFINLSVCLTRQNQLGEALEYADRAVEIEPKSGQTHLARGRCLGRLDRREEAFGALCKATDLDPQNEATWLALGDLCFAMQRDEEAKQCFQRARDVAPSNVKACLALSETCLRIGQTEEAVAALESARKLAPTDPRIGLLENKLAGTSKIEDDNVEP